MVKLVIVESPAKCKKIESYLGSGYRCVASFGHIYQLSDITKGNNYKPEFKLLPTKGKYIKSLRDNIKRASEVILATDDDREGEAIAWHICRLAKLPVNSTKRIVFHEITKSAVQNAIANPITIDMKKVHAQLGRQVLDRMVGFTISPVLWKQFFHGGKNKTALSAGRCQTPALRLVYDNQRDIDNEPGKKEFETTGYFTERNLPFKLNHNFEKQDIVEEFLVDSVNFDHTLLKPKDPTSSTRTAPVPFSTSTLQQRSSNILHYSPKRTMQIAQKLYEGGYITYMRTDNKKYSPEFIKKAVSFIKGTWKVDNSYIKKDLSKITLGKSKSKDKNAQEAHEAIRPTKLTVRDVPLGACEKKLYHLIWTNTLESCMSSAIMDVRTLIITAPDDYIYKYREEQVKFPGWMIVKGYDKVNELYQYISKFKEQSINYKKIFSKQTLKKLKSHFTEARLVQMLEKKGIGRPSTFSSLISKIQDREYVKKQNIEGHKVMCTDFQLINDELEEIETPRIFGNEKNKLVLQPLGRAVIEFLVGSFNEMFIYEYTEGMESKLDDISKGTLPWQDLCRECDTTMTQLMGKVKVSSKGGKKASHIEIDEHHVYMIGKYGPVIKYEKDGETTFKNVKKDLDIDKLRRGEYNLDDIIVQKKQFTGRVLGSFKNNDVILKKGKYGLYVLCNSKTYSLKGIRKNETNIKLEDVLDILLGKKSANPNVISILDSTMSVRKGKFGPYVYYKTEKMKKPRFFNFGQLLGKRTSPDDILQLVRNNPNYVITAVHNNM